MTPPQRLSVLLLPHRSPRSPSPQPHRSPAQNSGEGKAILKHKYLLFPTIPYKSLKQFLRSSISLHSSYLEVLYSTAILNRNSSLQRDADLFCRATIENSSPSLPMHPLKHSESTREANSNLLYKPLCYFSRTMAGTTSSPTHTLRV